MTKRKRYISSTARFEVIAIALTSVPLVYLTFRFDLYERLDVCLEVLEGYGQFDELIVLYLWFGFCFTLFAIRRWRELYRGEQRFRLLAENAQDLVFRYRLLPEPGFEYVSPASTGLIGYTPEEHYGDPHLIDKVAHPDEVEIKNMFRSPPTAAGMYTYRCIRKDGTVIWVELALTPVAAADGTTVAIEALARDVTERKNGEAALREGEERWSFALDACGYGVWDASYVTNDVFYSSQWKAMLGYEDHEIGNSKTEWIGRIHPDDFDFVMEEKQKHLNGLIPLMSIEYRLLCKDGTYKWIRNRGKVSHRDKNGKPVRMIGIHTDITAQKSSETELELARDAAQSASVAKSVFLANMSHEIRTPMNGITGMVELLRLADPTPLQEEYLDQMDIASQSLLSLINGLLDFSKIEAGKMDLEESPFGLRGTVNDVIRNQLSPARKKGLQIEVDIAAELPDRLVGDSLRLKQILLNLVGNAIKFTSAGKVLVTVSAASLTSESAQIRCCVADTGEGISEEVMKHIFLPFEQGSAGVSRRYGGTGLGLAICKKLTELMGGAIQVESREGAGTKFTFYLPFRIDSSRSLQEAVPRRRCTLPRWEAPPLRLLVAEDNEISLNFIVPLLEKMGHAVTVARDGKEALAKVSAAPFDLMILDIHMPMMDGMEVLKAVRGGVAEKNVTTPAIALTAFALRGDREGFLAQGFDGYLSKPFKINDLVAEMSRLVNPGTCDESAPAVDDVRRCAQ